MAWWMGAQRASGDRRGVGWYGCLLQVSGAKEGPGVTRTLFCVHSSRWEKLECVGVLAGRIPLRTGQQPPVGRGRVGLGTGMGGGAHSRGGAPAGILFPPRPEKEGTSVRRAVGGTGDAPWRGGWCAVSWAGSPAGLTCCFSHRKESLYK